MNICILSMQKINNMGSLLQAYGLKKILEQMGHSVEFMDILKNDEDYACLGDFKQQFYAERESSGIIGKLKKIDRYTINRLKIKSKSTQQDVAFNLFRQEVLATEKTSTEYDACVIGSDEVFNCLNAGSWGFTSQLFGNVPQAKKVITYAASCGSTKYRDLPELVAKRIKQAFENISAFSVRDKNTYEFVSKLTSKPITDNLDPVLIYDFYEEIGRVSMPEMPEHYCVVYSYYNRIHSKEEINAIRNFCREHQLTPVAVGAPQFWIKDYVVCSPFQCLKIFEKADFVITDTFHGTIFASKYAARFAILVRDSNRNKLMDLIDKLQIQAHLLADIEELEEKYNIMKDSVSFGKIIKCEKERMRQYLDDNI